MKNIKNTTGRKQILVSDLLREHKAIKGPVEKAVNRVVNSGRYILGRELSAFEEEFANYIGTRYAVGVASGTEALQLSLSALGIGAGDEVITAVNTAIPTAMAIVAAGAVPQFVDVEEKTFNIDVSKLGKAVNKKTKAIIPVHLYGNPCDVEGVLKVANRHSIAMVEDACQAHGASINDRKVGTFGDLSAFSFYPTKNLGCYGDGGMVVTNDKKMAGKVRLLRNYGQATRYICEIKGMNSRLDEVQAAILRVKLTYLEQFNARRSYIAHLYEKYLGCIDELKLPVTGKNRRHVYHLYVIRCNRRESLRDHLSRKGVETQVHYPIPLHLQKAFAHLGYVKGDFPVAESLATEILSLPIFPHLKDAEVRRICSHIKDFYRDRK